MNKNEIEKLCEWAYHKGKVCMMETMKQVFTDDVFSKPICDLIDKMYELEKKDLEEAENGI